MARISVIVRDSKFNVTMSKEMNEAYDAKFNSLVELEEYSEFSDADINRLILSEAISFDFMAEKAHEVELIAAEKAEREAEKKAEDEKNARNKVTFDAFKSLLNAGKISSSDLKKLGIEVE